MTVWAVSEKRVVFHSTWLSKKMAVFTWNVWTSERALRTASVLLQGTTASSLPPVGSQKEISGTESHCEGNVAASVRNVSGSSAEGHEEGLEMAPCVCKDCPSSSLGLECSSTHRGEAAAHLNFTWGRVRVRTKALSICVY